MPQTFGRSLTAQAAHTSSYAQLTADVRAAGLLERRYGYYWGHIAATIACFAGLWIAFFALGESWLQLLVAAGLGIIVAQFGFLGHDAAHRQIFASAVWNAWAARILAGVFAGLSYSWWRAKHNKHHQAPNQEGVDPDIGPGAIAFTPDVVAARTGWKGWFAHHQGWLFFPLLTLEGLNLHAQSVTACLDKTSRAPWRRLELAIVSARLAVFAAVVLWWLPLGMAAAFLAVQLAVFGVRLGAAFAPAHKGMPLVPATMKLDFLRRQVLVSRNIDGNMAVDYFMGGLNYQIEHHLFPNMPRCNLKRAQPIVREFCQQADVRYTQVSLLTSYGLVVDYLNNVGLRARDPFDCPFAAQLRG